MGKRKKINKKLRIFIQLFLCKWLCHLVILFMHTGKMPHLFSFQRKLDVEFCLCNILGCTRGLIFFISKYYFKPTIWKLTNVFIYIFFAYFPHWSFMDNYQLFWIFIFSLYKITKIINCNQIKIDFAYNLQTLLTNCGFWNTLRFPLAECECRDSATLYTHV